MSSPRDRLRRLALLPKRYAGTRTVRTRRLFHYLFVLLNLPEFIKRRRLAQLVPASPGHPKVPEDRGFMRIDFLDRTLVSGVVEQARGILRQADLTAIEQAANSPVFSVPIEQCVTTDSPILKFALNPDLLALVAEYVGVLPVLTDILLYCSPNRENFVGTSQYFHLDGQDVRMVKVWVHIEDISDANGPLTCVDARHSDQIAKKLRYRKAGESRRLSDEAVFSMIDPAVAVHKLTGPAGTVFLIDTDRCFHLGSRPAAAPRYAMTFQYASPFAFVLPWNWRRGLPFAGLAGNETLGLIGRHVLGSL